jgi:hypothetical protein
MRIFIISFILFTLFFGCSSQTAELEGPPVIKVVSTSGEAEVNLLIAGIPLNIEVSVETAGEVICQRHQLSFAGSQIVGYAPGSDPKCGDEKIDIDWTALIGTIIKVAVKLL